MAFHIISFLDSILKDGLLPPSQTGIFSNKDMFQPGDENYIYFTSHFDKLYAENSTKKHGGKSILVLAKISPSCLELDNLFNRHSNAGIDLKDLSKIYEELKNPGAAQARTREKIPTSSIVNIIDVDSRQKIL